MKKQAMAELCQAEVKLGQSNDQTIPVVRGWSLVLWLWTMTRKFNLVKVSTPSLKEFKSFPFIKFEVFD